MGYAQEHLDFGDEFNFDDESMHPPTPEEQQAMLESISIMQAVALLRDRGYAVVEPVDMDDQAVTP